MSFRKFCVVFGLIVCVGVGAYASLRYAPSAPSKKPEPPKWIPQKTSLPPAFIEATAFAFAHGLPDPTEGEFREITLPGNSFRFGDPRDVVDSGWVLPAKDGEQPVVIYWDGLPYRAEKIGAKLNLSEYIEKRIEQLKVAKERMGRPFDPKKPIPDIRRPATAMEMALLVRVGEPKLAEKILPLYYGKPDILKNGLYRELVVARYNRCMSAFASGHDEVAAEDGAWIGRYASVYETQSTTTELKDHLARYSIDAVIKDVDRRFKKSPRSPFDFDRVMSLPEDERVSTIVDRLDDVDATMYGSMLGSLSLTKNSIYKAVLKTDAPMLEALLTCAQNDKRLSRCVEYEEWGRSRGGMPVPRPVSVSRLALFLIRDITGIRSWPRDRDGQTDLESVRSVVHATKGMTVPQILFQAIANDQVDPKIWIDAANALTQPEYEPGIVPRGSYRTLQPGQKAPPMFGETLRIKRNPSLTDLLSQRALKLMRPEESHAIDWLSADNSVNLAKYLTKWDAPNAINVLQELSARLKKSLKPADPYDGSGWNKKARPMLGAVLTDRLKAGDLSAQGEFESWIDSTDPVDYNLNRYASLSPLADQPKWGDRVAKRLFLGPKAKWNPIQRLHDGDYTPTRDLLQTKLTLLNSVRTCLISDLNDRTVIGQVWMSRQGTMSYDLKASGHGEWGSQSMSASDSRDPALNVKVPFRACDFIAFMLADFKDAPRFRPFWSIKDRDAALKEITAYVQKQGPNLPDARPFFMIAHD